MNRIDRLTGMILLLQSHRVITAEQIAAHYEISVRTVYRDLVALGEAGVPIVAEAGIGYRLVNGYHMPPVMFTEDEAAALFLSGEVTDQIADSSLSEALGAALLKIRSILPVERRDYLARLQQSTSVWLSPQRRTSVCLQALMPLQEAIVRRRCISVRYDAGGRGEITSRVIEPVGLVFYARKWHLIAFCRLRGAFRDFRVDRLQDTEVLIETYEGHEDFSVERFLENEIRSHELIPATLIIEKAVLERFRSEFMCTPVREESLPDGRIRVEILSYSVEWLTDWILSFGPAVWVEQPRELQDSVRNAAHAVVEKYAGIEKNKSLLT